MSRHNKNQDSRFYGTWTSEAKAASLEETVRQSNPEGIVDLLYALERASGNRIAAQVIASIDNKGREAWETEQEVYNKAFADICALVRRLMNDRDEWREKAEMSADNYDDLLRSGGMPNV